MIHSLGLWPFGTLLHPLLHLLLRGRGAAATCVAETPVKNSLLLTNEETGKSLNTLVLQRSSCGSGQLSQPSFSWSSGEGNCTGWIYGLIVMCQPCSCHLPCWSPWQFLPKWNICGDLMDRHVAEGRRNSFLHPGTPSNLSKAGGRKGGEKKERWAYHHCSVAQSCPPLCDPKDCSMPGFPVLHHFPEFAQTHVHWVGDAIQPHLVSVTHLSSCLQSCPESDG